MISKPDYPELLRIILFEAVTQILSLPALVDAVSGFEMAPISTGQLGLTERA